MFLLHFVSPHLAQCLTYKRCSINVPWAEAGNKAHGSRGSQLWGPGLLASCSRRVLQSQVSLKMASKAGGDCRAHWVWEPSIWGPWMGFKRSLNPQHCAKNNFYLCPCFSGRRQTVNQIFKGSHQPSKAEVQQGANSSAQRQMTGSGQIWARTQTSSFLSWGLLLTNCPPCGAFMSMTWSPNAAFLQPRKMARQLYSFIGFCFPQTTIFCNGKIFLTWSGSIPLIHQPSIQMSSMPKQFSLKWFISHMNTSHPIWSLKLKPHFSSEENESTVLTNRMYFHQSGMSRSLSGSKVINRRALQPDLPTPHILPTSDLALNAWRLLPNADI